MTSKEEQEAASATRQLADIRTSARTAAHNAIHVMLARLGEVLTPDDRLRGAPNLASSTNPFRGYRVRAQRVEHDLPFPKRGSDGYGRETLVLTEAGTLSFAKRNDGGEVDERPAVEADLLAEDVANLAETILVALARHTTWCGGTIRNYHMLKQLSDKIKIALDEEWRHQ